MKSQLPSRNKLYQECKGEEEKGREDEEAEETRCRVGWSPLLGGKECVCEYECVCVYVCVCAHARMGVHACVCTRSHRCVGGRSRGRKVD